jgi:hypothetical protein
LPEIERIVTRQEFSRLFGDCSADRSRIPEYLLVAREGCVFKTVGGAFRKVHRVSARGYSIPLSVTPESVTDITGIRKAVENRLAEGRVALIFVEGLGVDEFPWPYQKIANGREWFFYETGDAQYLTISRGNTRV